MKPDREMAVLAMQNMGWDVKRVPLGKGRARWEFRRPDTGGLWDLVKVNQNDLSMFWVSSVAMNYGDADDLLKEINDAREKWLRSRFLGIYSRSEAAE